MTVRTFFVSAAALVIIGVASAGATPLTFANTNAIVINDSASPPTVSSPYPSTIEVTGLSSSVITKVTVQLRGFAHTFPSDVDIVLVGPEGQNAVLMGTTGGSTGLSVTNVNLTLDDDAETGLPLETSLVSGTFRPTQQFPFGFDFPPPAPPTSQLTGPSLASFKNTRPNGTWKLFVIDNSNPDSGVITGGWSLSLTITPLLLSITQTSTNAILSWTNAVPGYTLQATPKLAPASWANVTNVPADVLGNFTVTNALTNSSMFYRLAK